MSGVEVMAILAAAGTALKMGAAIDEGLVASRVHNMNARGLERQAKRETQLADTEIENKRIATRKQAAAQRAMFAANGVDLGSDVVTETLSYTFTEGFIDQERTRNEALARSAKLRSEANMQRYEATNARISGFLNAGAALLGPFADGVRFGGGGGVTAPGGGEAAGAAAGEGAAGGGEAAAASAAIG